MSISPFRRAAGTNDAPSDFAIGLEQNSMLRGRLIRGLKFDGTSNVQYFEHGLGRYYEGVLLAGQSSSTINITLFRRENVEDAGFDPRLVVGVRPSAIASTTFDIYIW